MIVTDVFKGSQIFQHFLSVESNGGMIKATVCA
jgi:hypothetical protein